MITLDQHHRVTRPPAVPFPPHCCYDYNALTNLPGATFTL